MNKLYIPTSSLNFNNIMSSESISPKAFYSLRGFGYSRWQIVNENNIENVILLYEQPFTFSRPISDVEDHPMLIEITTDKDYPALSDGVYYCDHTIYLSPWRTRFFFFNEQDKTVTLSLSDSSLETKMMGLYQRQLYVKTFQVKTIDKIDCKVPLNHDAIDEDCRINKLKGLLYGYYIGALLSTTPEIVKKANILQELQNIFSSVLSSETKIPTISQYEKLTALFYELNKTNPLYQYILTVLKENDKADDFIKTLKGYGVSFPDTLDKDRIISSLEYATENYNPAFDWLKKERQVLRSQANQARCYLYPSDEEIVISDVLLSKIKVANIPDEQGQEVMKAWVNNVFISKEYDGKISTFAEPLSDAVTKKAKEVYGDSWEESISKVQLNQMRRYVRGSEATIDWENCLVSSIAAVIAKGCEWEQLFSFMQSKYITDYRIAFAFFAELNGFANLTRDFTDLLFNLQDRRYVASVYKEIYGQLLGEDPSIGGNNSSNLPDYIMLENKNEGNNNCVEIGSLSDKVEAIIKANSRRKLSEKDRDVIKSALDKSQDGISFINMIANEMESLTKGIFPCLQKELHPNWKPIKTKRGANKNKNIPKEQSLFGNLLDGISKMLEPKTDGEVGGKSIIYDVYTEDILNECSFLPFDIKKQIVDLFKEFQKNYQEGYYFKNQEQYKRNNTDVIDHFVRWCLSPKNKRGIKWSPETSKLMDELKIYLMNVYAD